MADGKGTLVEQDIADTGSYKAIMDNASQNHRSDTSNAETVPAVAQRVSTFDLDNMEQGGLRRRTMPQAQIQVNLLQSSSEILDWWTNLRKGFCLKYDTSRYNPCY
jgi:hypothetical protein